MSPATQILQELQQGDPSAAGKLLVVVYDELRSLAACRLARERPGQTLQATALVHEAYLRLVDRDKVHHWENRGHFFAAAAQAMQRILVEQARFRRSQKGGGGFIRQPPSYLTQVASPPELPPIDLLLLDEALTLLEARDPAKAQLVRLRYFAGVSLEDASRMLNISPATAKRYWIYARAWLYGKLQGD